MSNFKNIKEYFSDNRPFVVPYYQRGYKWSLQKNTKRGDLHLNLLLDDLLFEYKNALSNNEIIPNYEYYLQGITVKENSDSIELVDGQQRTTSLFIILCVLKNLGVNIDDINLSNKLKYDVRKSANEVLQSFIKGYVAGDDSIQDIAALKKAWGICYEYLGKIANKELFTQFLLNNIQIIYVVLNEKQDETKVFSMMNKDKAEMSKTDLVKSNILREASRQIYAGHQCKNSGGFEWQINQVRSKLATEWDNWRKWWENENNVKFCKMLSIQFNKNGEPNLSGLLQLFINSENTKRQKDVNVFEFFKNKVADRDNDIIEAIEVFRKLKLFQSILQEWLEDNVIYNYLGLFFKGCDLSSKENEFHILIEYYIKNKTGFWRIIKDFYIKEILQGDTSEVFLNSIMNESDVYHNMYSIVARQLLRMNVVRSINAKQKFDFDLYEENHINAEDIDNAKRRSLEHIKPQAYKNIKGLNDDVLQKLNSATNTIGNLVLLPKGLNSKLSNLSFDEKKEIVFKELLNSKQNNYGMWLHTLAVFGSKSDWLVNEIENNKKMFFEEAIEFYI